MTYKPNRRTVLRGMAVAGIGVAGIGTASADDEVQYIVTGGNPNQLEREGYTVVHEITGANVYLVTGPADEDPSSVNGVEGAFEDFSYEVREVETAEEKDDDISHEDRQWDKEITDTFAAHEYATGEGTYVGILDTGVDHEHPDLGNVDTGLSQSFVGWEQSDHIGDARTHGTHVAGIAGATGAEGITGTAPETTLVSLRVFGEEGGANVGDSFLALDYVADVGLDAVNMSIGSPPQLTEDNQEGFRIARQRVVRSVTQRGTTVVTSAGNDATDLQHGNECRTFEDDDEEEYEICGNWLSLWGSLPNAMSISSTGPTDELAFYSNYGQNDIAVGAPGGDSEYGEEGTVWSAEPGGGYRYAQGTSMSAPQVAGLVGLVKELRPDANPNQVESIVQQGAEGSGRGDPETGAGRINVYDTVSPL
jgi:subtilisin family serine protease